MSTIIVVGAGSAGMTLAWRLSQDPAVDVVLIEAGTDPGSDVPDSLRREMLLEPEYYWPYTEADTGAFLPRGKVMGGSSAANAAAAVRGQPLCLDSWGLERWTWAECLPAFIAVERDEQFGAAEYHGSSGPIPITRFTPGGFDAAFAEQYEALGYRRIEDHNAPGEIGFAPWPTNRVGNDRASTLLQLLPDLRTRPNVRLMADTEVRRIVFDGVSACGVAVTKQDIDGAGGEQVIEADEVVLSAGAFGSPELLFASGIGDPDALTGAGISVRVDHPSVGRNLCDHAFLQMVVDITDPSRYALGAGKGNLLTFELDEPGAHIGHLFAYQTAFFDPTAPISQASVTVALMSPQSRGHLDLGAGPRAKVHLGHYTHPEDVRRGVEIVVRAREVIDRVAQTGLIAVPDDAWWTSDDSGRLLRKVAVTYHHPAGTCRMGNESDAVVDQTLQVRGVERLFVADASVMPKLPRATPNLATMMIGWRAADLLNNR
jgi:choline dehydrogenase-like flavoprotein